MIRTDAVLDDINMNESKGDHPIFLETLPPISRRYRENWPKISKKFGRFEILFRRFSLEFIFTYIK